MWLAWLLTGFQPLPQLPTSKLGPSVADSQVGGFVTFSDPVGLSNELSCEVGYFSSCSPHRFLPSEILRLYFLMLEPWIVWSVSLPSCSSQLCACKCETTRCCLTHPGLQLPPFHVSSLPQLPISILPTGLDECFFFKSLVLRLPYNLIFWQFWLFFVFKFLLPFFWLYELAKCIYLHLHLGQKS